MSDAIRKLQPHMNAVADGLHSALSEFAGKSVRFAILVWDGQDSTWAIRNVPSLENAVSVTEQITAGWKSEKVVPS